MRRVMLDTNVYEFIMRYLDESSVRGIIYSKDIKVYGNSLIRKELRDIPKEKKEIVIKELRNLRVALLSLYDLMTGERNYEITEDMKRLAGRYFTVYKTLGGSMSREAVVNDFIIVACATIHALDIVVSEDNKTMRSEEAIKAYQAVNNIEDRRTPEFTGFGQFERMLRGVNLD